MVNAITPTLAQLVSQAPILFVYVVGMMLALIFWRRCPGPSLLTLLASLLLFVSAIVQTIVMQYIIQSRIDWGWSAEKFGYVMSFNAIVGNVVRTIAFGMLLTAIFSGRSGPPQSANIV